VSNKSPVKNGSFHIYFVFLKTHANDDKPQKQGGEEEKYLGFCTGHLLDNRCYIYSVHAITFMSMIPGFYHLIEGLTNASYEPRF